MNELKKKSCDFCGDKFYKKVETNCGWANMCRGCCISYMGCENCNLINLLNQLHEGSDWVVVDADFNGFINSKKEFIEFIWDTSVLPKTRNEAILTDLLYDGCEEIRKKFELRKKIKKRLYCKFFRVCRGFFLNSITCTHKGGGHCGKFRKFTSIEEEKPKLAPHETLILCPKCGNKTLLVSEKAQFNTCININCCYFERQIFYQDSLGYS